MSDDFLDDDSYFDGSDPTTPQADRALGLVVGPIARVILGPKGEVIFDELMENERRWRRRGRPTIRFIEEAG